VSDSMVKESWQLPYQSGRRTREGFRPVTKDIRL
jgi:hypothetical protein